MQMRERTAPEFIRFSNPGDRIEGKLISVERTKVESGIANKYTVEKDTRDRVSFLGGVKLDELLGREDVGHFVFIALKGESKISGDRTMKEFVVSISAREVRRLGEKWVECELSEELEPPPSDPRYA